MAEDVKIIKHSNSISAFLVQWLLTPFACILYLTLTFYLAAPAMIDPKANGVSDSHAVPTTGEHWYLSFIFSRTSLILSVWSICLSCHSYYRAALVLVHSFLHLELNIICLKYLSLVPFLLLASAGTYH